MRRETGSRHPAWVEALLADDHDVAALLVAEGAVAVANAAARACFGRDDLRDLPAARLFDEGSQRKLRDAMSADLPGTWELEAARPGAEPVAVRVVVLPLARGERLLLTATPAAAIGEDVKGKLLASIDELANVTRERSRRVRELEAAHASLERLGALREEFIAALSHDLRSPLATVRLLAALIETKADAPAAAELRRYAGDVARNVDRMMRLTGNVLSAARLELGDTGIERQPVALDEIAREVVDVLEPLAVRAAVTLRLTPPREEAVVRGDRDRLAQVLENLVTNAIRYAPKETAVDIRIDTEEALVRCSVEDRGPGVPRERREEIFERFRRIGTRPGAAGLGLYVARRIIELHGGRIWAEDAPEGGARFVFELASS